MSEQNKPLHPRPQKAKQASAKPSRTRKNFARFVALLVSVAFVITVTLIVEARHSSFYGEPLLEKMVHVAKIKING